MHDHRIIEAHVQASKGPTDIILINIIVKQET